MMKKTIARLLAIGLLLASAAVAQEAALPAFEWERDMVNHWKLEADGQRIDMEAHVFDDAMLCTVCNSEVWDYGDGSGCVNNYDEQGNLLHYTDFDVDGAILNEIRHSLTYDENGVLVLDLEFIGETLYLENIYRADADGCSVPVKTTCFNDDGTLSVNEYDENGNCIRTYIQHEDGTIGSQTLTEYEPGDDGWYYEAKVTDRFDTGEVICAIKNQYGDTISYVYTEADGSVSMNITDEFEYVDGVRRYNRTYSFGVLVSESFYDEEGCNIRDIDYEEDGTYHVTTYDENDEPVTVTYNAAGEIVEE